MKFLRRISTGSMPSSLADRSTKRSITYVASGRPAPRYASTGVVCVKTPVTSQWMAGVVYEPASSVPYRYVGTAGANSVRYAPRFATVLTRRPRIFPSALKAISASVW